MVPLVKILWTNIVCGFVIFRVNQSVGIQLSNIINSFRPTLRDYLPIRKRPIEIPGAAEALAFVEALNDTRDSDNYPDIELLFITL